MKTKILKKKNLYISLFAVLAVSLLFFVSSVLYTMTKKRLSPPPLLGNSEENISSLNEEEIEPRPFSIFFVSDFQASSYFERFYNSADFPSEVDFGVILGDFCMDPRHEYHTFFISEFNEWGLEFPILLVPGNHDVASTDRDLARENAFTREDFEETYGPRNLSFTHAGCYFIIIDNLYNDEYLTHLKDALSKRPDGTLLTFLFMHIPPSSLTPHVKCRGIYEEEMFYEIIDAYNVDYVITGDFHSYLESEYNDTVFLVTGGGGAKLAGDPESSFHHSVVLHIDPERKQVTEKIYPIAEKSDLPDDFKIFIMGDIYTIFRYHPILFTTIIVLHLVLLFVLDLLIHPRKKKEAPLPVGRTSEAEAT
jgi:predicted phosphodiesterase